MVQNFWDTKFELLFPKQLYCYQINCKEIDFKNSMKNDVVLCGNNLVNFTNLVQITKQLSTN